MVPLSSLSYKKKIGQLLFFGFDGPDMCEHARRAIREQYIGNVILFSRNFKNPKQLFSLIKELQYEALEANGIPLFVAADQEGGQVTRFTNGLTWFNGEMAISATGDTHLAEKVGEGLGAEMARLGLNFNLAPVVDLASNPNSPHIGSRSFSDEPGAVVRYAEAFVRGMQKHVIATAKHFPSIGGSPVDLHLHLGRNTRSSEELEMSELAPVAALAKGEVKCVMTSHEVYSSLDNEPGTLSKYILQDLLRGTYGYKGLVISDCMEMKALANYCGTAEGCVRAVLAGVDLMLVCHTESVQSASAQALLAALISGRLSERRLNESVERILKEKEKINISDILYGKCPDTQNEELFSANRALTENICEKSFTNLGKSDFFKAEGNERFLFIAPPPAALTQVDENGSCFSVARAMKSAFPQAECEEYPLTPDKPELNRLMSIACKDFSRIFICTCNAHLNKGQQELLTLLLGLDKEVGVIVLRNPFDLALCTGAAAVLLTYEYTPTSVSALINLFKGTIAPQGSLPIPVETGGF